MKDYDITLVGHIYQEILHSIAIIEIINNKMLEMLLKLLIELKRKDKSQNNIVESYIEYIKKELE